MAIFAAVLLAMDETRADLAPSAYPRAKRATGGIFSGQPYHWSRQPLGLVHDACPTRTVWPEGVEPA